MCGRALDFPKLVRLQRANAIPGGISMDRHGRLASEKMQGTHSTTANHIPCKGSAPSVYGLAVPSCQAICILTDADCHSSELVRTLSAA